VREEAPPKWKLDVEDFIPFPWSYHHNAFLSRKKP
jgi:hypothetical protein